MGGKISIFGKLEKDDDQDRLRKYNEELNAAVDGTFPEDDSFDKKKVVWWERLIFDKRARITYVTLLAVLLGIIIPVIIFATKLKKEDKPIYGSCLIKQEARFQCLLNSKEPVTSDMCVKALCCWQDSENLPFKCYHSFPSAYQYNVSSSSNHTEDSLTWTNIELKTSHSERMSPLEIITHWESDEHLMVEIFNSDVFSNRTSPTRFRNGSSFGVQQNVDNLPFSVSWGEDGNFFFMRIARQDTDETIFDTRLGPVYATENDITLATLLPSQYFYGLKGGQGLISPLTYSIVNGFENSEFPFYTSFENSGGGQWHGVLVDTTAPILVQVIPAPGLMLQLETSRPEINLHFFAGPSQPQILAQLHAYIQAKYQVSHSPMIPPFWGSGLHLCRKLGNSSMVLQHLEQVLHENKSLSYDSDCIDEDLRHPIFLNETHFAPDLKEILDLLQVKKNKKIVLSQKVNIPAPPLDNEAGNGTIFSGNDDYFKDFLVLDTKNRVPFVGRVGLDFRVNYIDFFNTQFLQRKFPPVPHQGNQSDAEPLPYHGFSLGENIPITDFSREVCPSPDTFLQSFFTETLLTTSDNSMNSSFLWGTLCPLTTTHTLNANKRQSHLELHNVYGEQSLKIVHKTVTERHPDTKDDMFLTSGSFWTGSMYYGAYNGMQVPFTWKGLQESVANVVRNYAIAPVSGTPICGAILQNNLTFDMNNELCLRWFQFGLLLPFARNSYNGISSFGPEHFSSDQYRRYLNDTVLMRYSYSPYYYTGLLNFQSTFVPLVRPISFDFSRPHERNETLPLLTQFMIGDALFAAPIIDRGVTRNAYFPSGVWYTMNGEAAFTNLTSGETKQISGFMTQTPMFIRGGHMIPILQEPIQGSTMEESLKGNYSLIAALPTATGTTRTAKGTLTLKEPNISIKHFVNFSTTVNTTKEGEFLQMVIKINSKCGSTATSSLSTVIDEVRVFGLEYLGALKVTIKNGGTGKTEYDGAHFAIRLYDMQMDWCGANEHEVTVTQVGDEGTTKTTIGTSETDTETATNDSTEPTTETT